MDGFNLIQSFFTQMSCNFCQQHFEPEGIDLIREDNGVFLVSVFCHHCDRQIGVAMVGLEAQVKPVKVSKYADPELTKKEKKRLSKFEPIKEDDVLDAHYFFESLDENWAQCIPKNLIPKEFRVSESLSDEPEVKALTQPDDGRVSLADPPQG